MTTRKKVIAERLKMINWFGNMHFAFDNLRDESKVLRGIEILQNAGFETKRVIFYVLTGYDTTFEEDLYRINFLKEHDCAAFVMQYRPNKQTRKLARYVNRRWLYWSIPFEEYNTKNLSKVTERRKIAKTQAIIGGN